MTICDSSGKLRTDVTMIMVLERILNNSRQLFSTGALIVGLLTDKEDAAKNLKCVRLHETAQNLPCVVQNISVDAKWLMFYIASIWLCQAQTGHSIFTW